MSVSLTLAYFVHVVLVSLKFSDPPNHLLLCLNIVFHVGFEFDKSMDNFFIQDICRSLKLCACFVLSEEYKKIVAKFSLFSFE